MADTSSMEKLVSLAKRRGFIFHGSEIYEGVGGIYDLGPLGVELANNIKELWWKKIVQERDDVVGLDSSILMNKEVWQTSGHINSFTDPLVECKNCHTRFREDALPKSKNCPVCGKNDWTGSRMFNLMFKTHIGPVQNEGSETFLRPETAQGIFVNFGNIVDTMRVRLPFGIAQIGKGFRNEITTGNFLFRVREFEMMELEFFTYPEKAESDFVYWQKERMKWHESLGLSKKNLRFREHESSERAHYADRSVDIEYNWPFMGWGELEGIANRTDYDLKAHSEASGKDLSYFDDSTKKKIIPYVIEPSVGVGRAMLAVLVDSYTEEKAPTAEKGESETRVVLKLNPSLAPIKVAILPLVKDEKLIKIAKGLYRELKEDWFVQYDEAGSVGRRYRRQDEAGTPYCVTVDFDSLKDNAVTVRDRDSMKQDRVKIKEVRDYIKKKL
jgi:glycyl-tRNA synthetase